jgi:N-acyl-phosphatidylethanolamine-hydrolysing phospholipase D
MPPSHLAQHANTHAVYKPMRKHLAIFLLVLLTVCLVACSSVGQITNPYYDATKPHHRPNGFQNNYINFEPKNFFIDVLLGWKLPAALKGIPKPPKTPTPTQAPDLSFIRSNALAGSAMQAAVTWVGHATALLQAGGLNILTDPIFSERASPISFVGPKRAHAPGIALADLPQIDAVLISHNHYDHLDEASVKALNAQKGGAPLFIVPLGIKPWLAERGITNTIELDWWQAHVLNSVEIILTPVQHWSARGTSDRLQTLWGGYAIFAPSSHLFFAGDTGYSQDFSDIQTRFAERQKTGGFDLALIPIGAYEPRWFMQQQHINPEESVRIHKDLKAKASLGIHWGTFELTDESLDEPPQELAKARTAKGVKAEEFFVLKIGETRVLPKRL